MLRIKSPKVTASPVSKRILHVRLPCWKIFPSGVVYLADHLRKQGYDDQFIFDLALVAPAQRRRELRSLIDSYQPDFIAFSWRNIQTFGPHDASPALETVLKFDYAPKLMDKLASAGTALAMVGDHIWQKEQNLKLIKTAVQARPKAQVVVGGPAFSTFCEQLIERLPSGVIGVVGEGERALAKIVAEEDISGENVVFLEGGKVRRHYSDTFFDLASTTAVDFSYISRIFPRFKEYTNGFIGVQTKRGCPYECIFCVYNVLEGCKVRFKNPAAVADEIEQLNRVFGVNKIWFTDSQFCSTRQTVETSEALLDEVMARRLAIGWTGYIRIDNLTESFARKALASGILSFELSFTGSQRMIDELHLGYQLSRQLEQFKMISELGYQGQQIKLYLPLNAPGETRETLLETVEACKTLYGMFGESNVVPWIFFLAIQPGTRLERRMIDSGYLKPDYNPLSHNPFNIKKLLYNPSPLGPLVARAHLNAKDQSQGDNIGRQTLFLLEQSLAGSSMSSTAV